MEVLKPGSHDVKVGVQGKFGQLMQCLDWVRSMADMMSRACVGLMMLTQVAWKREMRENAGYKCEENVEKK